MGRPAIDDLLKRAQFVRNLVIGDSSSSPGSAVLDRFRGSEGGRLRVGVDLGTATCVLVVLAADHEPVWVDSDASAALRDGVVVDFARATQTVRDLKRRAEDALGIALGRAATAYPPMVPQADARACRFVCQSAGFDEVTLVDEVTAAASVLELRGGHGDGVVVDVGGGSTGVGVFRDGEAVAIGDRAGGGHHLDLILAGALGVDVGVAEKVKRERPDDCGEILAPGFQRIAESIRALSVGAEELDIHLAGGAVMFPTAARVIADYLDRTVVSYPHALWITPLGIARAAA